MKRRKFIHQATIGAGAMVLAPRFISSDSGKAIGVQLYSIREEM